MKRERRRTNRGPGSRWAKSVGKRIAIILQQNSLTQDQFAERCGVSKPSVNGWLNGAAVPRGDNLSSIAEAFGVSVDWLLDGVNGANEAQSLPAYRGQWRDDRSLEADFAGAVLRAGGFISGSALSFRPESINLGAVIRDVTAEIGAHEMRFIEFMRQFVLRMELQETGDEMLRVLKPLAERDSGAQERPDSAERARAAAKLLRGYYQSVSAAFDQLRAPQPEDCRYLRRTAGPFDAHEFQRAMLEAVRTSGASDDLIERFEARWSGDVGLRKITKLRREWAE